MRRIIWIVPVIFFIIACASDDVLVTFNNEKFTVKDLNDFYQFSPNDDSLRRVKVIDDFINQQMAIMEAKSQSYADDPVVKASMETNRRDIIIRSYYQIKVIDKIKVKDSEIRSLYEKLTSQYHLAEIVVDNDSLAQFIKKELKKGIPFESLLVYSLDTISPGGDIGMNSEFSIPPEVLKILKRTKVGNVAGPINIGDYIYFLKVIERKKLDSPKYGDVKQNIKDNLFRQKVIDAGEKFVDQVIKQAKIEYNQKGLDLLLKPESTLTENELNEWVVKKYDTNFVRVKTLISAVQLHLKRAPDIDPKFLIERELVPDLVYDLAIKERAEKLPKVNHELKKALNALIYQKYYSDNVLEKVRVDSQSVVAYFNQHKADYPDKKLNEVYTQIFAKLRDDRISQLRDSLFTNLREKYQPQLNKKVYAMLLKGEKK
ncbi:MAG: peptidyl-prolyl cis-trans isomerase [candidate division WOR-3 bacterium]